MPFEDVYLVSEKLSLIPEEQMDELEENLGFALPRGYREYLQHLGDGWFCHGLHVFTPKEAQAKKNIKFWADVAPVAIEQEFYAGRSLLTDAEMKNSVIFAKSDCGDLFVSCPEQAGRLFELPRDDDRMYDHPDGFLDPFQFRVCCERKFNLPFFEPSRFRRKDLNLELRRKPDVKKVWNHMKTLSSAPLQVAEGRIGRSDRVVAYIPEISGCAWQEDKSFYFFVAPKHAKILDDIRQRFEHLAKS